MEIFIKKELFTMNVWKIVGQVLAVAAGVIQIASYFVDDINTQNYIKTEVAEQTKEPEIEEEEEA